ncbi:MAG: class I SAM-dependent methyltransferase [Anaerolineales bacterium]|uniref:class I SAM-dependent methyltransferase n=1 Tax=Candidatus Villigracilis vicinus TaxID=3140679 RepID=UPI003136195F|nr:class I SAM-dependent methyltransferase [Anaerolineales bacterium]
MMMDRILEPELMEDMEQAIAYAHADFSSSHQMRVTWFHQRFGMGSAPASILDLCCGGGDMTFRFARAFPNARIVAVDGSQAMLDIAAQDVKAEPELTKRIRFIKAFLPNDDIPQENYDLVMSHSALHHFHDPLALWETIRAHTHPGTMVFVSDLRRVESVETAQRIVRERAGSEHPILQNDFAASLCAAFTISEVREQLKIAGLPSLRVETVGDVYMLIHGVI